MTKTRPLATLLLACATAGTLAPTALATTKAKPASAATILKDCTKDNQISKRYRLADLKAAQKKAKTSKKKYGSCSVALTSAVAALSGKAGKNSISAVIKECNSGALKHKYKLATLKKASKNLPADVKNYGDCDDAISSQIHTLS
ncbi:MAG: hypothetical protein AAGC46_15825 [Solirubrobacteraceae bacterium]|nr:hypothetical protein [Patulibacter sp.]